MSNVLILSLVFPPDSVSTAQIMGELALDLKSRGHKVSVLTTTPHYNREQEAEAKQPIYNYWGPILQKSNYHDIPVYHTLMPQKGGNLLMRLFHWLNFHLLSTIAGMMVIPKPDIIIVPSPPLTIGVSAWLLGRFHKSPYIYNVQEMYPDLAIKMGIIRNKWLIQLLLRLESFVYSKAHAITVIAPRMKLSLIQKGVVSDKVKIIPNFVDIESLHPLPKNNEFSRQYDVHNKFMISYAGNMGPAQQLESFIEAAAILRSQPHIHFMMMGDGILREKLKQRVTDLDLHNFTFLPYQPYSLVPQIYAASDLCLVPQASDITNVAIPSKVYRIMACARSVLATTVLDSDLAQLVNNSGGGLVVEAGSAEHLANAILHASHNELELREMGQAGRIYVMANYSRTVITERYNELIESIVRKK